ncbi:MAG: imidazoleglycerol-phosphate dehydratase, partial [bacterium]|nr:imidazoleglycerol-phosphate dehydratase [bacterium]
MSERQSRRQRSTTETNISIDLHVDGDGRSEVSTGLPFFDHMLAQLARHGGWSLTVSAQGDLDVDSHHTVEDTGILLGQCFAEALGDKRGVRRFAAAAVPLDEALVNVSLDLSGRPFLHYEVDPPGEKILGDPPFDPQLMEEFWRAFVVAAGITLHLVLVRG